MNKGTRFFIVVLSILGACQLVLAASVGAGTPLVQVFCSEYVRQESGKPVDWNSLADHLSHRAVLHDASGLEYEQCLKGFAEEFDRGEFLLRGLELLEGSKLTAGAPVRPLVTESAEVSVPGIGRFILASGSDVPQRLSDLRSLELRRAEYQQLWNEFLSDIRKRLDTGQATLPSTSQKDHYF